ncbi:hypothetical protein I7I48_00418 [Histoplasma ohiense]|nr:hypothetical protein I7I48_00418 [Histoplasma ohiense (nom. inval.)]
MRVVFVPTVSCICSEQIDACIDHQFDMQLNLYKWIMRGEHPIAAGKQVHMYCALGS